MTHEQQCSVERPECLLQLFNRRQIQMVGGLVEHEAVDACRHQSGELCAAAFTGGELETGALHIVRTQTELGEE